MDQPPRTWKLFFPCFFFTDNHTSLYLEKLARCLLVGSLWEARGYHQLESDKQKQKQKWINSGKRHQRQGPLLKTARITLLINPGKLNASFKLERP